jgi:hypothetical protein
MRDIWRDEFPKPEHRRTIRKFIIDPLLEYAHASTSNPALAQ